MNAQYRVVNQSLWPRKQQFDFYGTFEQPYFSIGFNLDAKHLYQVCKAQGCSFFHAYSYLIMKVVNLNEPFRLRVVEQQVRDYQVIDLSCTVLAADGCIRFTEIAFDDCFDGFVDNLLAAVQLAVNREFMHQDFAQSQSLKNKVYMSVIPWINFSSFRHAWAGKDDSGVPRIVVGKMNEQYQLPICVDLHHGLADGSHVGQFSQQVQDAFQDFSIVAKLST